MDNFYDDNDLFRDDPPTPDDAAQIAHLLHVISRHRRGFRVEISSDGWAGSGQYQVSIVPRDPKPHEFFGWGCSDTLEGALIDAVFSVEELRPFVSETGYPQDVA